MTEPTTDRIDVRLPAHRDSVPVRLVACARESELVVVVRDWGTGMRPRTDTPGLGLGLPTIATLAGSLEVEAADGAGTLLRMHFHQVAERAA